MSWVADVLDRLGVTGRDPTSFPDGVGIVPVTHRLFLCPEHRSA